jgi:UDP-N-acetylglucosamine diphosphorylase/glucosamine-1-phosphate N-acetyltransferase
MPLATVILAAGKGTRMKSDLAKVLHKISNKPLIHYVIDQAQSIHSDEIVLIVGHQKDDVVKSVEKYQVRHAIQDQQLGTGHAVQQAEDLLNSFEGNVLILSGDVPLLSEETLNTFIKFHETENSKATVLTAVLEDPTGYGRIKRTKSGDLASVVEQKDATEEELKLKEINTGIYIFDKKLLFHYLNKVDNRNSQSEYYLPDVLPMFIADSYKVTAISTKNFDETRGINTIEQLQEAEQILNRVK